MRMKNPNPQHVKVGTGVRVAVDVVAVLVVHERRRVVVMFWGGASAQVLKEYSLSVFGVVVV